MTNDIEATTHRVAATGPVRPLASLWFTVGLLTAIRLMAEIATALAPREGTDWAMLDQRLIEEVLDQPDKVNTLVLGNSHAGSFDPATLGRGAHVLKRAGGDAIEMGLYVDSLLPRLPGLERLYVIISPYELDWDNSADDASKIRRVQAYSALPGWRFRQGDAFSFLVGKLDPWLGLTQAVRADSWKGVLLAARGWLALSTTEAASQSENGKSAAGGCDRPSPAKLDAHALARVARVVGTLHSMAERRPDLHRDTMRELEHIIAEAQERSVAVILVTPPYWHRYLSELETSLPEVMTENVVEIRQLAARFGLPYLDHRRDPRFVHRPEIFTDSDHLNACGAAEHTTAVLSALLVDATASTPGRCLADTRCAALLSGQRSVASPPENPAD